jgi:hypothetical protein
VGYPDSGVVISSLQVLAHCKGRYFQFFPDDRILFRLLFNKDRAVRREAAMALSNQRAVGFIGDEYLTYTANMFAWVLRFYFWIVSPILVGAIGILMLGLKRMGVESKAARMVLSICLVCGGTFVLTLGYILVVNGVF